MDAVYIRGLELPLRVRGVTVIDEDGNYNVFINALLGEDAQQDALMHEVCHIVSGHFDGYDPVFVNELEACHHINIEEIRSRLQEAAGGE